MIPCVKFDNWTTIQVLEYLNISSRSIKTIYSYHKTSNQYLLFLALTQSLSRIFLPGTIEPNFSIERPVRDIRHRGITISANTANSYLNKTSNDFKSIKYQK